MTNSGCISQGKLGFSWESMRISYHKGIIYPLSKHMNMRITPNTMGISRGYNNNNMCMYIYILYYMGIYHQQMMQMSTVIFVSPCSCKFHIDYWYDWGIHRPNWESIKKHDQCSQNLLSVHLTGCLIGMSTMDYNYH